jgi:hypothetical protein
MDPILGILFLVGCWYAAKEGLKGAGRSVSRARKSAAKNKTGRAAKTASRQAAAGWWLSEIGHGFAHTRAGMAHGWRDHKNALAEREHRLSEQSATHAERRARWRDEMADHRRRIEEANRPAEPATPEPATRRPAPPLNLPARPGGEEPAPPPVVPNGGTMPAEINYEQTIEHAQQLKTEADQAVASSSAAKATAIADQLGAALRNDREGISRAAEAAAAAKAMQDDAKRLLDAAQALEDHIQRTHGPTHEAVAAAGVMAEPEFHDQ